MKNPQTLYSALFRITENISVDLIARFISHRSYREEWEIANLQKEMLRIYGSQVSNKSDDDTVNETKNDIIDQTTNDIVKYDIVLYGIQDNVTEITMGQKIRDISNQILLDKLGAIGGDSNVSAHLLQNIFLTTLDQLWKDHLHNLDRLRTGIGLRAYGQKNPLTEYKLEAFTMFKNMLKEFEERSVMRVAHLRVMYKPDDKNKNELKMQNTPQMQGAQEKQQNRGKSNGQNTAAEYADNIYGDLAKMKYLHSMDNSLADFSKTAMHRGNTPGVQQNVGQDPTLAEKRNRPISRNQPCYCGSRRKYKYCHGAIK